MNCAATDFFDIHTSISLDIPFYKLYNDLRFTHISFPLHHLHNKDVALV
jgi:hypothetical protein